MSIFILISLPLTLILSWLIISKFRAYRRNKLLSEPLPPEWIQILKKNVSLYTSLPHKLQNDLHGRINIFLNEKKFIGCNGQQITDEIKLTVASNACILVLKREKGYFSGFTSILIYPDTYVAKVVKYEDFVEIHEDSTRAGESWHRGPVVLSWADVYKGTLNQSDGHNVVLHEFAHKLDEENEIMDGLPVLSNKEHYKEWSEVLNREFKSLKLRVDNGTNSVIDEYGAVSPPEFFAVATESFFKKPEAMKKKLPELYRQLNKYYDLDPEQW